MNKINITKESNQLRQSRLEYLSSARNYAKVLSEASRLDPRVLSIVKDIAKTGESISVLDSHAVTDFYNKLLERSQVDKRYHQVVRELKKAKNFLDNAAYKLFNDQVALALSRAGIPYKKYNFEIEQLVDFINNHKITLLQKIAYAPNYAKDEIIELEAMIARNEVEIRDGNIVGKSKQARSYIKKIGQILVERVNNSYFGPKTFDIKHVYVNSKNNNMDVLQQIKQVGDLEHVRELERRIAASDVVINQGKIEPQNDKGKKYLALLSEEFSSLIEKRMNDQLLDINKKSFDNDEFIGSIFDVIDKFEKKLSKHEKLANKHDISGEYRELVDSYKGNILSLVQDKKEIISDIDRLSSAALDIRKKLILLANYGETRIEDSLPIISALKLLANFEQRLDQKIVNLAKKSSHRVKNDNQNIVPSVTDIKERYDNTSDENLLGSVDAEVNKVLDRRHVATGDIVATVRWVVSHSEYLNDYLDACHKQNALRKYLREYIDTEGRLYKGHELVQTILSEIVETELRKREFISEIIHEVELTHKKMWLSSIKSGNDNYLINTIGEDSDSLIFAKKINNDIISDIEKEISDIVLTYRDSHNQHLNKFLESLNSFSRKIDLGVDVVQVSADLKKEYHDLDFAHKEELEKLESEMKRLDKQLAILSEKSRKAIEKNLITDIKKRVNPRTN